MSHSRSPITPAVVYPRLVEEQIWYILLCLVVCLAILATVIGVWEFIAVSWVTVGAIGVGLIRDETKNRNKFDCFCCAFRKCKRRGIDERVIYCNSWTAKPAFFGIYVLSIYIGIISLIYIFSSLWFKVVALFFIGFGGTVLLILSLIELNAQHDPHFYQTPPKHPGTCPKCLGTGLCTFCKGTGIGSSLKEICPVCEGKCICPNEFIGRQRLRQSVSEDIQMNIEVISEDKSFENLSTIIFQFLPGSLPTVKTNLRHYGGLDFIVLDFLLRLEIFLGERNITSEFVDEDGYFSGRNQWHLYPQGEIDGTFQLPIVVIQSDELVKVIVYITIIQFLGQNEHELQSYIYNRNEGLWI
jgi:hypothetical protein